MSRIGISLPSGVSSVAAQAANALPAIPTLPDVIVIADRDIVGRDDVDQFTYHLKLYMTDPFTFSNYGNYDATEQPEPHVKYILAESGATDIAFDNLDLKSVISFTKATYTTAVLDIDFKLIEPGGCSLLDRIASVADKLKIDNFVKCPYFLEISFRGRDINTGQPLNNVDIKKTIPIAILANEIEINSSGSIYNIKAVFYSNTGGSDENGMLQNPVSVPLANTVSETLNAIADAVNIRKNVECSGTGSNQDITSDIYEFIVDSAITESGGDSIVRPDISDQAHKNIPMEGEDVDFSKTTVTVAEHTAFNRIIDQLMSVTPYMTKKVQQQNGKTDRAVAASTNFYKVLITVQPIGFNKATNDYIKRITYRVVPVDYSNPLNSNFDDLNIFKTYNYIFTGLNTEVLNFDCKLNAAWYIPIPRQATSYSSSSNQLGPIAPKSINDILNTENEKTILDSLKPSEGLKDFFAEGMKILEKVTDISNIATGVTEGLTKRVNEISGKFTKDLTQNFGTEITDSLRVRQSILQGTSSSGEEHYVAAPDQSPKSTIAHTYVHGPGEHDTQGAVEAPRDNSRSYVANMFDRKLADPNHADLLQAKLLVRGDPKWLNILDQQEVLIEFNLGVPFKSSADRILPEQLQSYKNRIISGIYRVITVTNNFSAGKYTQELNCVKILREDEPPADETNQAPAPPSEIIKKGETGTRDITELPDMVIRPPNQAQVPIVPPGPTTTAELARRRRTSSTSSTNTSTPTGSDAPVEQARDT